MRADGGRRLGFELTFFRVGVNAAGGGAGPWELRDLALAHFAISDIDRGRFRFHEKVNRMSPFTAAAATGALDLFNEGWSAVALPDGRWRIRAAAGSGDALDLVLTARKPPAIHGTNGISVKGAAQGAASHYYSMTRLEAAGEIRTGGASHRVAGQAWMDHEFSTSILGEDQEGWDWFSLQLEDGRELMLYQMRKRDGSIDPASSGSLIERDGGVVLLASSDYTIVPRGSWRSPKSGGVYPMGWRIAIPRLGIELDVREAMKDQELVTTSSTGVAYWEGAVTARGNGVSGVGYVEMTGYAAPFELAP